MPLYNVMGTPGEEPKNMYDLLNKDYKGLVASKDAKTGQAQTRIGQNRDLQFLDVKDSIMAMLGTGSDAKDRTFMTYANDLRQKLGDQNAMRVIESVATFNKGNQKMSARERVDSWFRQPHQNEYVSELTSVLNGAYQNYTQGSSNNAAVQNFYSGAPSGLANVVKL